MKSCVYLYLIKWQINLSVSVSSTYHFISISCHHHDDRQGEAVSPTDGDTSSLLFSTLPLQSIVRKRI